MKSYNNNNNNNNNNDNDNNNNVKIGRLQSLCDLILR